MYSTRERFCYHHGQNKKLHALPPPFAIKLRHHALLVSVMLPCASMNDINIQYLMNDKSKAVMVVGKIFTLW